MAKKIEYKSDVNPYNPSPSKALVEKKKIIDIRDERWSHPILQELPAPWYTEQSGACLAMYAPDMTLEEKIKRGKEFSAMIAAASARKHPEGEEPEHICDIDTYMVSGCEEEPDAPEVAVYVYRPKDLKKKKARCMFFCLGGALVCVEPLMYPLEELASRYQCVIVTAKYRTSYEAQYPGAVNDLHAVYAWMIENAEMLKINPDNVVLYGPSSGGHLALALGFRLKRYGYSPKGIVALIPQTDDRETDGVSIYCSGVWDSIGQHDALMQWLGRNFASNRVGPEALANHATVEDCIGYPPTFIHTTELDPDRDYNREFYGKLLEAKTFAEYHCWAGAMHGGFGFWAGVYLAGEANELSKRVKTVVDGNVEDCFNYDLRRPWVVEEAEAK